MLETVTPVQFHQPTASGRTRPSRLVCEKQDGSLVEVIAKFSAGCDRKEGALAMELIGACLAADLRLPVPQPYLLDVHPAWIATMTNAEHRNLMMKSSSVAFGSTQLGSGFRVWTAADRINPVSLPIAAAIFAFDAFISNSDRRDANPNCLIKGNELRIFDHELAFLYKTVLFWKEPWKVGALASLTTPGNHIFHAKLKGQPLDLAPIRASWAGLDDTRLQSYKDAVPTAWSSASAIVDDAIDLIRGVRDHIDDALVELARVLT